MLYEKSYFDRHFDEWHEQIENKGTEHTRPINYIVGKVYQNKALTKKEFEIFKPYLKTSGLECYMYYRNKVFVFNNVQDFYKWHPHIKIKEYYTI